MCQQKLNDPNTPASLTECKFKGVGLLLVAALENLCGLRFLLRLIAVFINLTKYKLKY